MCALQYDNLLQNYSSENGMDASSQKSAMSSYKNINRKCPTRKYKVIFCFPLKAYFKFVYQQKWKGKINAK